MRLRGRTVLLAALTLVPMLVAACGSPGAESSPNSAGDPPAAVTRTITDANGEQVEVPANPERVVTLSEWDLDAALALGVKPAGTVSGRGQTAPPRYLVERAEGIPIVGAINQPSLDQLIELDPDLILAGNLSDPQLLGQLEAIAPTVITMKGREDWKTVFKRTASALNKEDAADKWLTDYDKRIAEIKEKLGSNAGAEVSIVRWMPQGPIYMSETLFPSQVLAELGLKRPAHQKNLGEDQGHSPALSLEHLSQIDGDWIFLGALNPDGDAALETAMSTPAFLQLKAVKNNRVVQVDGTVWSSSMGPLAAMEILETVEQELAK